jgi:hypothetical protein
MVVKPLDFIARDLRGLAQPAVKCRGQEYLRIIYGPEYTELTNLARLRSRGLGAKRSLALREFALGIEALERFLRCEPLRRVHECVFGVLAHESEPVELNGRRAAPARAGALPVAPRRRPPNQKDDRTDKIRRVLIRDGEVLLDSDILKVGQTVQVWLAPDDTNDAY